MMEICEKDAEISALRRLLAEKNEAIAIQKQDLEKTKRQLRNSEKLQLKKRKKETESECVCSKRLNVQRCTAYENLMDGDKRVVEHHARTYVVAGSKDPKKTWACFLSTCINRRELVIEETLKGVLDSNKGSKVFTRVVRKKTKIVIQAIDTNGTPHLC